MKLAIIADIHANLPALEAVAAHIEAWQPDHVLVAGDTVNRGPRPAECLQFVQHKQHTADWRVTIGNHEEYVIAQDRPDCPREGPHFEMHRLTYWTYAQLNYDVRDLEALPFQHSLTAPDGGEIRVTHASMRGTRHGLYPDMPNDEIAARMQPYPALLAVGHTHLPFVRTVDGITVINVGSVGLPFDGDRRACYGQLTWHRGLWYAEVARIPYDRHTAEQDFFDSGFMEGTGPIGRLVLDEWRRSGSHLYHFTKDYRAPIMTGELSVEEAVTAYYPGLR